MLWVLASSYSSAILEALQWTFLMMFKHNRECFVESIFMNSNALDIQQGSRHCSQGSFTCFISSTGQDLMTSHSERHVSVIQWMDQGRTCRVWAAGMSYTRRVPSIDADSSQTASPLIAKSVILSSWPRKRRTSLAAATSYLRLPLVSFCSQKHRWPEPLP